MTSPQAQPLWLRVTPNALSAARLILAGVFPFAAVPWHGLIIVAAALSDFVDGYLARRFDLSSWIGGILDAAADKLFALTVLITFTLRDHLAWWQTLLLLSRDMAVVFVAFYAVVTVRWHAFRRMPSRLFGKLTTAMVFALVLFIAVAPEQRAGIVTLFAITAVLSAMAAADYLRLFVRGLLLERRR